MLWRMKAGHGEQIELKEVVLYTREPRRYLPQTIVGCVKSSVTVHIYILDRCNNRPVVRIFPLVSRAYENVLGVTPKNCCLYLYIHLHILEKILPTKSHAKEIGRQLQDIHGSRKAVMKY